LSDQPDAPVRAWPIFDVREWLAKAIDPRLFEGFSMYFWSEEGSEPPHVHVNKGDGHAKWWLMPTPREEYSYGFKKQERKRIRELITANHGTIIQAWNTHFKGHGPSGV
jgi:hypothetical protein